MGSRIRAGRCGRSLFAAGALLCLFAPASAHDRNDSKDRRDGWRHRGHAPIPALVCQTGQRVCQGPFGMQCYTPSRGEVCNAGIVCGFGQQVCAGPYGRSCYAPGQGQRCMQGLVCGFDQQVCTRGGFPVCYSPAQGQVCG